MITNGITELANINAKNWLEDVFKRQFGSVDIEHWPLN